MFVVKVMIDFFFILMEKCYYRFYLGDSEGVEGDLDFLCE